MRDAVLASIREDVDHRGGRTAGRLAAAGAIGVAAALGATLLLSGHPFGHHPSSHAVIFTAVWAGLLIVCLSLVFLGVRTPSLRIGEAAATGALGLGLAGICGAICPDGHFLHWWHGTAVGASVLGTRGASASALCFGLVTTIAIALVASLAAYRGRKLTPREAFLPTGVLLALLSPGLVLQSVGEPSGVFAGWLLGSGLGTYLGVVAPSLARRLGALVP